MTDELKTRLYHKLKAYHQENLLQYWDELDQTQRQLLADDIDSLDLQYVTQSFEKVMQTGQSHSQKKDDHILPLPEDVYCTLPNVDSHRQDWQTLGLNLIADNKVAVILLAGGQGTRLGVDYPKGMYCVGLPSGKSLYQIQGERMFRLQQLAQERTGKKGTIPWYIMTSQHTKQQTRNYFEKHKFFGLNEKDIMFFEQSTLPCFDFDGKIILAAPDKIARAPNGNGGLYSALSNCGILKDMQDRGIAHIQAYCVDNILIKMVDPVFTGYCASKNADCGAKVVRKVDASESVGLVCLCDGTYQVIEYSEISKEMTEKRNKNGELMFNAANICNHYFSYDFLSQTVSARENELPHHMARKKIPYVNESGQTVKPETPNGIKMEKFVFDVFLFSKNFAVMEVKREDEFSPLKNKCGTGRDCPETAKAALGKLHGRYILEAGGKFVTKDGKEISDTSRYSILTLAR
ncbi:uncharacterized protein TRIADDRAFT_20208 [Trichoplax adhaerens]|uniref:UDP-N-acetylglucosamine diphosphorylase n=1 Tax=Trichoplax adhaerens TaxID=10228 RepID=B3RKP9_TRIAD|nr:hypothetical protein TRIADDRAFT_20208 [Trichoplax adhaerens]EDV28617.1 hypothetical protein TRIADDRAFT_20208 [Trichoplax adhaerens]|eukprot:XP_002107819.1 hypothetical protein TRIADDRAFT_20208 [Trichoplax adhaerens]